MTATTTCRCGHPQSCHPGEHAGMCLVEHCECLDYRMRSIGAQPDVLTRYRPTLRDALAAGRRSPHRRTRNLADLIEKSITELVTTLRAEQDPNAPKLPVRKTAPAPRRDTRPQQTCPECGRLCTNNTGLASHRRAVHGAGTDVVECPDCGSTMKRNGLGLHRFKAHGIQSAKRTA